MHHAGLESVRLEQFGRLHVAMKLEGFEMCRSNVPCGSVQEGLISRLTACKLTLGRGG